MERPYDVIKIFLPCPTAMRYPAIYIKIKDATPAKTSVACMPARAAQEAPFKLPLPGYRTPHRWLTFKLEGLKLTYHNVVLKPLSMAALQAASVEQA
jgi:hypothetical protein